MKYLQLKPDSEPPDIHELKPFRSVVIVDESVTSGWQERISDWLVTSVFLYMMAWGKGCSSWDDSVDYSNSNEWNYKDIPKDSFVMTTWHESEPLEEVFWFSKHNAIHPSVDIKSTLLLHISNLSKEDEFLDRYNRA